jgi:hypothetical protein
LSNAKTKDKIFQYPRNGLVTRNTHLKSQNPSTYQSQDRVKVKVFNKLVKHQGEGHKVKCFGKVLSQGLLM